MKKQHHQTLKFHTIFTCILVVVCVATIILKPDWILAVSCALLIAYVAGNGIIHSRKNELTRDSIFEYAIVAVIVGLIVAGALVR